MIHWISPSPNPQSRPVGHRISNDVGEVTVEGKQDGVKLLGLRDHDGIRRLNGQVILDPQNLMPCVCEGVDDEVRDAVVREEAKRD